MDVYISLSALIFLSYVFLIRKYEAIWTVEPSKSISESFQPTRSFSILIPIRNEALTILDCLSSCLAQNYPNDLYEILIINDFSTDETLELIKDVESDKIKIIDLQSIFPERALLSNKKFGLEYAIGQMNNEIVVTLDGDSTVGPNWLRSIANAYNESKARLIVSPVRYPIQQRLIGRFQELDLLAMNLVTASGILAKLHYMGFGTNLSYEKELFDELGGFRRQSISSGDDFFLVQHAAKLDKQHVSYNKSADGIVSTAVVSDVPSFIQQRIRWGAKNKYAKDLNLLISSIITYLNALNLVVLLIICICFSLNLVWIPILFLGIKIWIDFFALKPIASFFQYGLNWTSFIGMNLLHIIYLSILGTLSIFTNSYTWKGRKTK